LSLDEFEVYTGHLKTHLRRLEGIDLHKCSSFFKDSHLTVHLVDPALFAYKGDPWRYDKSVRLIMPFRALHFIRDVGWDPFLLQGTIADPESLYTFKPRSDFCLRYITYGPLIIAEVISDKSEFDRWRMLFEGAAVCRYQNVLRKSRETIVICLYLNKRYEMERYLVYQAAEVDTRDVSVL
jgi:hypothetical protein